MTLYQTNLLEQAVDMWTRGFRISLNLYSKMLQEGLDVMGLEAKYLKD